MRWGSKELCNMERRGKTNRRQVLENKLKPGGGARASDGKGGLPPRKFANLRRSNIDIQLFCYLGQCFSTFLVARNSFKIVNVLRNLSYF